MLANLGFVTVLVLVFGAWAASTVTRHRRWTRMTPEERDRLPLARGGSTTEPVVRWVRRRLHR